MVWTAGHAVDQGESGCTPGVYRRRRPERTLAWQTVQGWLATWIAHHDEADAEPVPAYVQRELSAYLECGILAHGFARARCPDCTAEFLVAFSCKGRGVCPSCTTKRMAATAAHLVDSVIPRVPMRQWVLALPKRLRPALRNHAALATRVLRIFIGSIQRELRRSAAAPVSARIGAVSFLQRFGSALNEHWHYHCCVSDGVFAADGQALAFMPANVDVDAMVARVQARVRRRVLAAYRRHGVLDADAAKEMAAWDHGGGFSVDASVGIAADDRAALERVLRYCARPCWASERLTQADDGERLIYLFDKPRPDGSWQVTLTPLELLDRLARFIPPPRRHLHRYHGVFAPHAALRAQVAARAGEVIAAPVAPAIAQSATSVPVAPEAPAAAGNLADAIRAHLGLPANISPLPEPTTAASPGVRAWARLIARIYEVDPLRCRRCGGSMQLIAFITERAVIVRILDHLGEPSRAPRMAPIRGPPGDGTMSRQEDLWTGRSRHPDPPVDVMPDYENQNQDLVW